MLLDGSVLPTFAWEEQGAEAAALTLSQFRFMAAFFLSLPVAWLFRFVPTVRGERAAHQCPEAAQGRGGCQIGRNGAPIRGFAAEMGTVPLLVLMYHGDHGCKAC